MSCYRSTVIIIFTYFSILSSFVKSDNQRINQLCGNTYAPNVCSSCVTNKIGSNITDVTIIEAMLQCADDDANKLYNDTRKIVDDILTDETVSYVLHFCQIMFGDMLTNGGKLRDLVSEGKIADAKSSMDEFINQKLIGCNKLMSKYGIEIPGPVFSGMFIVEGDYKLSFQLMSSIHV